MMRNSRSPSRGSLARALRLCAAVAVATLALALAPRAARADLYAYEDIAEDGGSPTAVVWNGVLHVFWVQYGTRLMHSYQVGRAWYHDTLLMAIDSGPSFVHPTAVVFNNQVYLFYYDPEFNGLWYMVGTGPSTAGTWDLFQVDGYGASGNAPAKTGAVTDNVGYWSSAVEWNGKLYVAYNDSTTGAMRVGQYSPGTDSWALKVLDGGPTGQSTHTMSGRPTLTIFTGIPEAFYFDATSSDFRGAWTSDGTSWGTTIMDGAGGGNGRNFGTPGRYSAAVVWNNQPNLFYWDQSNGGMLRRAYYDGQWHMSTLDGASGTAYGAIPANVGSRVAAVIRDGSPEVFYYDQTNGNLRQMHYWGGFFEPGWHAWTMDGDGGPDGQISIGPSGQVGIDVAAVTFNDAAHTFYSWVPGPDAQILSHAWIY